MPQNLGLNAVTTKYVHSMEHKLENCNPYSTLSQYAKFKHELCYLSDV